MPSRNCVVVTASEEVIEESTGALVLLTSMSAAEPVELVLKIRCKAEV